jgi:hypothetical protein
VISPANAEPAASIKASVAEAWRRRNVAVVILTLPKSHWRVILVLLKSVTLI